MWPASLKAKIVAESMEADAKISDVARRHGARPSQVHEWRKQVREGQLALPADCGPLKFAPVVIRAECDRDRGVWRYGAHPRRGRRGDGRSDRAGAARVILPSGPVRVLMATKPVDFRKGMDGLAALVKEELRTDPFSGVIYLFRAKRANRVKLIFWDGTGTVMVSKRLSEGKFRWPKLEDGVMRLTPAQFGALIEGLDWTRVHGQRVQAPREAQ
jgi:transposase